MWFIEATMRRRTKKYHYKGKQYIYESMYIELPFWTAQLKEQRVIIMPKQQWKEILEMLPDSAQRELLAKSTATIESLKLAYEGTRKK